MHFRYTITGTEQKDKGAPVFGKVLLVAFRMIKNLTLKLDHSIKTKLISLVNHIAHAAVATDVKKRHDEVA